MIIFNKLKSNALIIDFEAECGQRFMGVGYVIEPDSENPILQLNKPLGFKAVSKILRAVKLWQVNKEDNFVFDK